MLDKVTQFVAGIVEGSDPELNGHMQRMGHTAAQFADTLGLTEDETQMLMVGAQVHDIGKLSINSYVLNKPGRLTNAEFFLIKQHCAYGQSLLTPLDLDPRIAEIVYHHHENFDGSGYPEGRANGNIPLLARIIRIVDSYDAITMDRPYHKGVSNEEALQILERDSHCYDPDLLERFCTLKH